MIEQQLEKASYLEFTHFRQFAEITHGVFTRQGGYSILPYQGLNTSLSIGDSFENVIRNRLLVLQTLGIERNPCATLWQVHGHDIEVLNADGWDDWDPNWPHSTYSIDDATQLLTWTTKPRRKADAIITRVREVTLALSFADCVPLLFYDPVEHVIGMAHGGWRGTARGIAVATVEAMSTYFGCRSYNIRAGIGPSIGSCCYEVSEQVQRLFHGLEAFPEMPTAGHLKEIVQESAVFSVKHQIDRDSLRLDLWETNRNQLLLAGLREEHIEVSGICTSCNTHLFFSHRAEKGKAGRFPVVFSLRTKEDETRDGQSNTISYEY